MLKYILLIKVRNEKKIYRYIDIACGPFQVFLKFKERFIFEWEFLSFFNHFSILYNIILA